MTDHKDNTEIEDGYDEYTCSVCGDSYQEVIEAPGCPSEPYQDVNRSAWYHTSVDFMIQNGYMYGMTLNYFGLNESLTRGQLAAILYRIAGSPDVTDLPNPFEDVGANDYYYKAIRWAYANNVVAGISETQYAPRQPITREQIASLLYRYKGKPDVTGDYLNSFPDKGKITPYAVPAINWAVSVGLMSGNELSDGTIELQPRYNASRAQCCSLLYRFVTRLDDDEQTK